MLWTERRKAIVFFVIIKKKIETYEKRDRSYQSYSWCDLCDCYSQPFLKTASRWVPSLFDSRVRSFVQRNFLVDGAVLFAVLYCTVLYCTVLYCTVLYCTVLYCTCPLSLNHIIDDGQCLQGQQRTTKS